MKTLKLLIALGVVAGLGAVGFLYSGVYNMGADDHHYKPVYWALETLRERSIAMRASKLDVPPLDDPNMLLAGGADYNEMCSGCHMKPGKKQSEISAGLYPQPPNLSLAVSDHGHDDGSDAHGDAKASAARQFWIIKHGIKASGMAAFGATHDDARIWAMVAFLQKLPTLDDAQYQILTARSDDDMNSMEGMDHGDASAHDEHAAAPKPTSESHAGMSMPGMEIKPATTASAATPQAAVDAFQAALKSGDAKAVERWLAPDVLIYEGGGAQRSRAEYVGQHLAGDIAFMKKTQIEIIKRSSGGDNETAWVTTESRIRGESSKGKPLDVASTETVLLRNTSDGWRIVHLHWSSQDYKVAP
jgi:ketosteroid isomerase-like protein